MKTKEFISATRELGFNVRENHVEIVITDVRDYEVCSVSKLNCFSINTRGSVFLNLESDVKEKLLTYLYEYAKTPLEEREEEKKYRYEFPIYITAKNIETKHICRNHTFRESGESNQLIIDTSTIDCVVEDDSFHFTNKEVEQHTGKDRALFDACEKIEVTP